LRSRPHRVGFPCSGRSPCHACRRHYPGGTAWLLSLGLSRQRRPSPLCDRVGSHIILFEACSAFTHVTACMRAESPMRPFDIGVLQRDSLPPLTAPTASGWSDTCRVGLSPTGDRRLCTAHRIGSMNWRCDIIPGLRRVGGRVPDRLMTLLIQVCQGCVVAARVLKACVWAFASALEAWSAATGTRPDRRRTP